MTQLGDVARQMVNAPRKIKEQAQTIKNGEAGKSLDEALKESMGGTDELKDMAIASAAAAAKIASEEILGVNPFKALFSKITFELPASDKAFVSEQDKNKSSKTGAYVSLHDARVPGFIIKATIRINMERGMDDAGPYEDTTEDFKWYSKSFGRDNAVVVSSAFPETQIAMNEFQGYVVDLYRNWRSDLTRKTAQNGAPKLVPRNVTRVRLATEQQQPSA